MNQNQVRAYAAMQAGGELVPYQFDAGELQAHQVEIKVEYCGLIECSMSKLGLSIYPSSIMNGVLPRIL